MSKFGAFESFRSAVAVEPPPSRCSRAPARRRNRPRTSASRASAAARRSRARSRAKTPADPAKLEEYPESDLRRRALAAFAPRTERRLARSTTARPGTARAGGHRAAPRRYLHVARLLQRPRALDRPALFPLQQPVGDRSAARRVRRRRVDRQRPAAHGGVGLLRSRLSARSDREPVPVQDRARALRGVARRDARPRRPDAAHATPPSRRMVGPLRVAARPELVRGAVLEPDADDPVAAHARVSDAHGAVAYHDAITNATQWPAQYCWPEGFMRRWHYHGVTNQPHSIIVTPKLVQIMAGDADNFVTNVNIGRAFNMDGAVPRLGADVPRWYGETIGFWDKDVLITWTSNIQGWMVARQLRVLEQAADDRDLHAEPRRGGQGHRARTTKEFSTIPRRSWSRSGSSATSTALGELEEGDPFLFIECVPSIFPVERPRDAGLARHRDRVQGARHVRPPVGADLGGVPRAGHGAARGRGHFQLRLGNPFGPSVPYWENEMTTRHAISIGFELVVAATAAARGARRICERAREEHARGQRHGRVQGRSSGRLRCRQSVSRDSRDGRRSADDGHRGPHARAQLPGRSGTPRLHRRCACGAERRRCSSSAASASSRSF